MTTVVSPDLLSETRLLASLSKFDQFANSDLPGVNRPSGIFGGNALNRQQRDEQKFQLVQNLTWRRGAHTLKFGIDITHSKTDVMARFNPNGNFIYNFDESVNFPVTPASETSYQTFVVSIGMQFTPEGGAVQLFTEESTSSTRRTVRARALMPPTS